MTAQALLDRLRPGRDANDSTWSLVRYPADWRAGAASGLTWDAGNAALELTPIAQPSLYAPWLPNAAVAAPDGTLYAVDTDRDLLLQRGPCAEGFSAVPGIGGHGFATGRFDMPTGVTVDAAGRVYVADAGNARVQVLLPQAGAVLAVLAEGLVTPVHVAVAEDGAIYVADRGTGSVHVFTSGFAAAGVHPLASSDPWTGEDWTLPPEAEPLGIAVLPDGTLAIFDPARPALWHMCTDGTPLEALAWPSAGTLPGWAPLAGRFGAEGEIVLGPIDGGVHNLAWHRIAIDADLPPGTALSIQSFASNANTASARIWSPRAPVPVVAGDLRDGEADRLILPDAGGWALSRLGRLDRATPVIHRFGDDAPGGAAGFTLPAGAARRLAVGDLVAFATAAGGRFEARITAASDTAATLATGGASADFIAPSSARLAARDGIPLPYGPLDLGFLDLDFAAIGLGGLNRDGQPEPLALPHALAMLLKPGDVVRLGALASRFEVIALDDAPVSFALDVALPGAAIDFIGATLTLVESTGRLVVEADLPHEATPPGTHVSLFGDVHIETPAIAALDPASRTIWLTAPLAGDVTAADWRGVQFADPAATDRGRYLWVRLRLIGATVRPAEGVGLPVEATATPSVRALRLIAPRPSLLHWLPAIFSRRDAAEEAPGANFLERFLTLFEGDLTRIETAYESVSRLLNPQAADAEWLRFVGAWLDLAFDPSWPIEGQRQLVLEGAKLQAGSGTPASLARYIEIYTGHPPTITEGFRQRPSDPIELGLRGALGVAPLGGAAIDPVNFAHRFTVSVRLAEDRDRAAARATVRRIVETMKPAHTSVAIDFGRGAAGGIGVDGAIGDIVIPGPEASDPCACDPAVERARGLPFPGHLAAGFQIGGTIAASRHSG
ncbi:phage tail protein [Sphingomonas psychrotolerans]|uniref:Phage tail protein domain-containing protein n=1 Tax=Sphingomonas psychrotolerans TaxID=1327635 RepID=A0A2K8MAJ7_9SPHN|nr:phage tail protein [Sphingomonas psychrotolerans]ATY30908.1 hypothetical protein CVN68_02005 [Sphingomonas psychrotolerans]